MREPERLPERGSHDRPAAGARVGPQRAVWEQPARHHHSAHSPPGYYTQISTLADAQENVMEYLHVLSRPMVINHDHDITWTEAYMDSKVGPDPTPG